MKSLHKNPCNVNTFVVFFFYKHRDFSRSHGNYNFRNYLFYTIDMGQIYMQRFQDKEKPKVLPQ